MIQPSLPEEPSTDPIIGACTQGKNVASAPIEAAIKIPILCLCILLLLFNLVNLLIKFYYHPPSAPFAPNRIYPDLLFAVWTGFVFSVF